MDMASTSLKVFPFVQRGLFKTIVRDCGRVTEGSWDQDLQHYEGLAALGMRYKAFPAWTEVLDTNCPPPACLLSALFQVHSFPYMPPNFWYKALSANYVSIPLYQHSYPCSDVWPDWFPDGQLKNTNSAVSVFSALKPSLFRRPETRVGSEIEHSWTSCSRTNRACTQRKTDGRREIPGEHMVDGARNESIEMNCRFGEMRGMAPLPTME